MFGDSLLFLREILINMAICNGCVTRIRYNKLCVFQHGKCKRENRKDTENGKDHQGIEEFQQSYWIH